MNLIYLLVLLRKVSDRQFIRPNLLNLRQKYQFNNLQDRLRIFKLALSDEGCCLTVQKQRGRPVLVGHFLITKIIYGNKIEIITLIS